MSLSAFISSNFDEIMRQWERQARSFVPEYLHLTLDELRDHVGLLLQSIASDLDSDAALEHQAGGRTPVAVRLEQRDDAARTHADSRHGEGFDLASLVAEYRALRNTVLRLWARAERPRTPAEVEEAIRFHEAVDRALAESIKRFSERLREDQNLFMAVLGHDMRTPLSAIRMASHVIAGSDDGASHRAAASRITNSCKRIQQMVDDLLGFTMTRLHGLLPVRRAPMDLAAAARRAIDEISTVESRCEIRSSLDGNLEGHWDESRILQLLSNLLSNSVEHGARGMPVELTIRGEADGVWITIHNVGEPIPEGRLLRIFEPFERAASAKGDEDASAGHLGLGLFVAREIVASHHGRIVVSSTREDGTTFRIWLPRVDG